MHDRVFRTPPPHYFYPTIWVWVKITTAKMNNGNEYWLAVLSDTHGHERLTKAALAVLKPYRPKAYFHAGDIGSETIIRMFPNDCPCYFVHGNCDRYPEHMAKAAEDAGHQWHGELATLSLNGRKIALVHGDQPRTLANAIESQQFDLVIHGHTHQTRVEQKGKTLIFNPGAVYRANPRSVALLDLNTLRHEYLYFR